MKKFFSLLALTVLISTAAMAAPRAVGIRASWGAEASYQHAFGNNFLEGDLGLFMNMFDVHAVYNFIFARPDWSEGEWAFYAGPGVGFYANDGAVAFTIAGQIGGEYTFAKAPIQLSLDLRPDIVCFSGETSFFKGWVPALGIRYRF